MARADDHDVDVRMYSKKFSDLCVEMSHIVSVSLLPEAPEVVQVLPDLGSGDLHPFCKIVGGDAVHIFFHQIREIAVISGQSGYDCLGDFFLHDKKRSLSLLSFLQAVYGFSAFLSIFPHSDILRNVSTFYGGSL